MNTCFHCGDNCEWNVIKHDDKSFCCLGCKTVYDIFQEHDLSYYYDLADNPGITPSIISQHYDFLDNDDIIASLLDFDEQGTQIVSFLIPSIHCSSCIWVLENLNKIHKSIKTSQVNFPEKTVQITFASKEITLKEVVQLISRVGYEPYLSADDLQKKEPKKDRKLIYKLGVAGFAFGNIMFLSFPEYFEINEYWLNQYKFIFRWLMFAFSLPVVFYAASDYFLSAFKGLKSKSLTIDVPIAIGIMVLFIRSTMEITMDWGTGFFDSLSGLVFFLLLGRYFQEKTYAYLSFERDYKSYLPLAVTRLTNDNAKEEEQVRINELNKGDRVIIRNDELIPIDAVLIHGNGLVDYSFVTGESNPVAKRIGDKLFAGGRQKSGIIEIEVLKTIEQSYLTQLWSNEIFSKNNPSRYQSITNKISKKFTITILTIAVVASLFWLFYNPSIAFNVFTAVLIVACPCAIALAAPFTLGNLMRIFGKHNFYVKNSGIIEQMAQIDTIVFDKTGTLTTHSSNVISYEGIALNKMEEVLLTSTLRASNHPLSRSLYELLKDNNIQTLDEYEEELSYGIRGVINNDCMKIGSYDFVAQDPRTSKDTIVNNTNSRTAVHLSSNNIYKGCYLIYNKYRDGVKSVFDELKYSKEIVILSGDNDGERQYIQTQLPENSKLLFNQKPMDKLAYIKSLQEEDRKVMMVGDGLNDAGALAQSNVGIVISENVNVFSPACDVIMEASKFQKLASFISLSKRGMEIIKWSFILSIVYNLVGLGFAVTGNLEPVVAAILMPLSSISIVIFTTMATQYFGDKLNVL